MMAYWGWWVGALALGSITFFYHLLVGRRFGVSSAWERVVHWKVEREAERSDQALSAAPDDFQAALMAATQSQFGASGGGVAVSSLPEQAVESTPPPRTRLPMTANATSFGHDPARCFWRRPHQRTFQDRWRHGTSVR